MKTEKLFCTVLYFNVVAIAPFRVMSHFQCIIAIEVIFLLKHRDLKGLSILCRKIQYFLVISYNTSVC